MKKLVAILLALVLVMALSLVACGGGSDVTTYKVAVVAAFQDGFS